MKNKAMWNGFGKQILWLVERRDFGDFLIDVFAWKFGPSITVRRFDRPETTLQAFNHSTEIPDVLMTSFYFDGDCKNGLWLTQEARKMHPHLKTIVTSGFPLEHLRGVAADLSIQPDLLLAKSETMAQDWFPLLRQIFSRPANQPQEKAAPQVSSNPSFLGRMRQRGIQWMKAVTKEKPLVYLVGPSNALSRLKAYAEVVTPSRRAVGYDAEHFERPELARASLLKESRKPDVLVTDYYLSGGYWNGLKLIRDAQTAVPGIRTVLANCVSEHHLRGLIDSSGIQPDFIFDERGSV